MAKCKYKRILLKLSGESFCKAGQFGIDGEKTKTIAERIIKLSEFGCQIGVVVGGGKLPAGRKLLQRHPDTTDNR